MPGRTAVTFNDKRKAKTTFKMFVGFSAFFLVASVLSAVFTPRSRVVKGIDNDDSEQLKSITAGFDGDQYSVISSETIQRYSMDDNSLLGTTKYADEIYNMCLDNHETFERYSFESPTLHFEQTSSSSGCYLIVDDIGDIFKYDLTLGDEETTCTLDRGNYWLTDRVTVGGVTYRAKYRTRSIAVNGDYLYYLGDIDNKYVVNKYDVNHLDDGVIASKTFVTITSPTKDQKLTYGENAYIIDTVDTSDGENPYSLIPTDKYLYLMTSAGIQRWSADFKDYDVYETDPLLNTETLVKQISYLNDGSDYFVSQMKAELLLLSADDKATYGITDEQIANGSTYVITQMYKAIKGDNAYVVKELASAKEFKNLNSDWIIQYDPSLRSEALVINKEYTDVHKNLTSKVDSSQTVGGMCYSPVNESIYYLDLKSATVYQSELSGTDNYKFKDTRTFTDASESTGISYKGKTFSDVKGNITYDKYSNSIHVTFYSSKDVSVIDLNGDSPSLVMTFGFEYDIRTFLSNKNRTRIVGFHQTEKRSLQNVATFPLHASLINPNTYKNRTAMVVLCIISIVLFGASVITLCVSGNALRHAKSMLKIKVVGHDLKKNKWTYVALIPFVVLLIMFCWVEAVGSISFSFFNYTLQKPSYIWNTFGNYIQIFNDANFWTMFGNTAFFLVFDLFLGIVPPIFFAFCLSIIKNKKLSGFLRGAMFVPAVVPGIASLLIWKVGIYGDTGVLNQLICFFKTGSTSASGYTPVNFLHDEDLARWSLLLMGFPYVGGYLIFYGGIMNIPKEYDEACQLEGIGVVKRFITVDLPLIKPQIKYIFVMGILGSVQNYERTYMLGSSGTMTLVESMYRQMKDVANPNYGLASAYATIIFILLLFPVLWNFRNTRKQSMGDAL